MDIKATRECAFNGDDDQKVQTLKYQEGEMLSTFLRLKVADYLPYTNGLTVWTVYMGSNEDQPTSEAVSSFGVNELYCAIHR